MAPLDLTAQALALLVARDPAVPEAAPPEGLAPGDLAAAYRLQEAVVRANGLTPAGYKLAATSQVAQDFLGLQAPLTGCLFRERIMTSPASILASQERFLLVEPEYAFTLGRDLPPRSKPYAQAEVAAAVASLHPAFEIVTSAYGAAWTDVGAAALVADNAAHAALVLGPACTDWQDLDSVHQPVTLTLQDERHSQGEGARALGSPLAALTWLSRELQTRGQGLRAGQVVTTGVVTDIAFLSAGQTARADFGPLGSVSLSATKA
ncbi:MAG: fumarylacetoacetate (FAA) hydrolase [Rhodospirillales bacterium]